MFFKVYAFGIDLDKDRNIVLTYIILVAALVSLCLGLDVIEYFFINGGCINTLDRNLRDLRRNFSKARVFIRLLKLVAYTGFANGSSFRS